MKTTKNNSSCSSEQGACIKGIHPSHERQLLSRGSGEAILRVRTADGAECLSRAVVIGHCGQNHEEICIDMRNDGGGASYDRYSSAGYYGNASVGNALARAVERAYGLGSTARLIGIF